MKLEKRIRALERGLFAEPVILHFADGSSHELRGPRDLLLTLALSLSAADVSPEQARQLDLIRQCSWADEPGSGHMVELLRALMSGPAN